jgi:hypothetical protein
MSNIIGAEGLLTKGVIGEPGHLVEKFFQCLRDSRVTSVRITIPYASAIVLVLYYVEDVRDGVLTWTF